MASVLGLSGGIATGKSTVAGFLSALGASVIDADAIVHETVTFGVVGASARRGVEQAAGECCVVDFAGVFILELEQAAAAATVAKRFPLVLRHLRQGFALPERFFRRICGICQNCPCGISGW